MFSCPFEVGYYDESLDILICRPSGELNADVAHDLAICRECIEKAGLHQVNRFHDLSRITSLNLRFSDIMHLCDIESDMRTSRQPVKACYLVPNAAVYGVVRMYQTIIERRGVHAYVSYDIQELAHVLGVSAAKLQP